MNGKVIKTFLLCFCLCCIFSSCNIKQEDSEGKNQKTNVDVSTEIQEKTDFALNTVISIKLYEAPHFDEKMWEGTFEVLRDIESKMSCHIDDSEIMKINKNAGIKEVKVSPETFVVVKKAKDIALKTKGAFDPCIGAVTKLWQIGTEQQHVPSKNEIDSALQLLDYNKIMLDEKKQTVFLKEKGMFLDLGGIAKGYSADKAAEFLKDLGVERGILDFGGNISFIGLKAENTPWRVGIRKPDRSEFKLFASLLAKDESVVSSGDYERFFEENGKIYHHIINPFTGYPVDNGIRGASVILESSMEADAYATALMVMGKEEAIKFIEDNHLEAILIFDDMSFYSSFDKGRDFKLQE